MKMKHVLTVLCVAMLSAALFAFASCETGEGAYVMNDRAELSRLTVSTASVTAPSPINSREWADWDHNLGAEDARIINLQRDEDLVNVYLKPQASEFARVAWGIGDKVTRPAEFYDYRVPATFNSEDYIYIRVTSEDTTRTQYYRFYVFLLKKGTNLDWLEVDGKRAVKAEAAGTWDFQYLEEGTLSITVPGAVNAEITTKGFEDTSTFRFAKVADGSNAVPAFSAATRMTFTDMDILYVEVTAQNGVDKAVYKFRVLVGRIANVAKLSFVGTLSSVTADTEVTSRGFPKAVWGDVSPGTFASADMRTDGYNVKVDLEDPGSTCEYQLMTTAPSAAPASGWTALPSTGLSAGKILFNNSNWLAIKVTSQGGPKTRDTYRYEERKNAQGNPIRDEFGNVIVDRIEGMLNEGIMYYKINVELLAANFKRHPESKVYYYYQDPATAQAEILHVDIRYDKDGKLLPQAQWTSEELLPGNGKKLDYASPRSFTDDSATVVALDFELDRAIPDGTTYQWWESNSWYGGYGFDPDGNVCYNIQDSAGNTQFNYEAAFRSDEYHHQNFDEKGNPSLFNGGNQQACYVVEGKMIPENLGGKQKTYKPRIDYRPFNMGYSNETHYYWVVITFPGGRTATSARAVIVSERNPDKQYYVVDVNNVWKDDNGMPIKFKNVQVFKEQYDKFRIPLAMLDNLPKKLDVMDYKYLTAQARFYLADGRDWIQNWTNGNLSFEDNALVGVTDPDAEPLNPYGPVHKDGKVIVLFHNLTNNNGVYDLNSDGKEPSVGSPLDGKPTHIVIEPSGSHTKGVNKDGYPPLGPDGKCSSSIIGGAGVGDLQGWFCGYVELVELRFESPSRK
jgi:hypothetical protein